MGWLPGSRVALSHSVREISLYNPAMWEASPLALSQQLSSFSQLSLGILAVYPEGPTAQPRVRQR